MKFSIRFLNKVEEVRHVIAIGDKAFFLRNGKVRVFENGELKNAFLFDVNSFYKYEDLLFSDSNFYYSIKEEEIVNIHELKGYYYTSLNYRNLLAFTGDKPLIYDFMEKRVIWKGEMFKDRGPWAMNQHGFLCYGKKFVSLYDYRNNTHVWEHNYSDLLKGIDVDTIGTFRVMNDHLYIWLYDDKDAKNNATFRIDIPTGEVIQEYRGFGGTLIPFNGNMIGKASYHEAAILNTETNEIIKYDLSDLLKPLDIQMSWTLCKFSKEGLLYFAGSSNSRYKIGSKNKIGIIDLNTQTLLWYTAIDIPEGDYNINQAVMEIIVQNNLLYVHCSDYTVHIFELSKS